MSGIVQIVPQQTDDREAVLAFARGLASGLAAATRCECEMLSPEFLEARTSRALSAALAARGGRTVLVHYVNYAYEPRGCPDWLVDGLEAWATSAGARLVTIFHEVHASGPPWTRAFWTAGRQRDLARRLLRSSAVAVTSLPLYGDLLRGFGGEAELLPVFSPIGEPGEAPPLGERPRDVVLFGGVDAQRRAAGPLRPGLEACLEALEAQSLVCIGRRSGSWPRRIGAATVVELGPLDAADVAVQLLRARAGVSTHAPAFLAKSTVYAAYAAHGLAPVALGRDPRPGDPLLTPYWSPWEHSEPPGWEDLGARARAGYARHDLAAHVRFHAHALGLAP